MRIEITVRKYIKLKLAIGQVCTCIHTYPLTTLAAGNQDVLDVSCGRRFVEQCYYENARLREPNMATIYLLCAYPDPFIQRFNERVRSTFYFTKGRARPGFEPGTSRTRSENHTPRPTSRWNGSKTVFSRPVWYFPPARCQVSTLTEPVWCATPSGGRHVPFLLPSIERVKSCRDAPRNLVRKFTLNSAGSDRIIIFHLGQII